MHSIRLTLELLEHVQRTRKRLYTNVALATLEDKGVIGPVAGALNALDLVAALYGTLPFVAPLVDGRRRRFAHLPAEPGSLQDLGNFTSLLGTDCGCN